MDNNLIKNKLKLLPHSPGVYLMKNIRGKTIYIGKSKNLKNRVSSYFRSSNHTDPKIRELVKNINDIEYIITSSEMEALILECNLIKNIRPRYNVRFKDGTGYPYIKIRTQEKFPGLEVTTEVSQDDSRYYGPYTKGIKNYIKLFRSLFPLRTCQGEIGHRNKACFNFYIKRCYAPCLGEINGKEYGKIVKEACLFLEGRHRGLIKSLKEKITLCAKELKFERASVMRDQLFALKNYSEKQKVVFSSLKEEGDFIGTGRKGDLSCVEVYFLREGTLINHERFLMNNPVDDSIKGLLAFFIKQFYGTNSNIPGKIYLEEEIEEQALIEEWLKNKKGKQVKILSPKRGKKKELIVMAKKNAIEHLTYKMKKGSANT